jgi:hypothetical protein
MRILTSISPKILTAAAILLAASSPAFANGTIYLEVGNPTAPGGGFGQANPYQYGNGGEFTALVTNFEATAYAATGATIPLYPGTPGGYNVPAGYSTAASANATFSFGGVEGFETFCIEDQVDFYVNGTYNYSIGNSLQQGTAAAPGTTAGITTLTAGAAWLYEQFSLGKLQGFNYTNQAERDIDAGILQATLWALQEEPGDSTVPYVSTAGYSAGENFALQDLINEFGSFAGAQGTVGTVNSYGVSVLELYSGSGSDATPAQDQLVYWGPSSVPDNGTTALLIGASLLGLAVFKRRLKGAARS